MSNENYGVSAQKSARVVKGDWFSNGFEGTMGELLCAIEEGREPENNARANLKSLKLAFAAIASADSGKPEIPGNVTVCPG